jgi:membrane glycosyltransferase
MSTSHHSRSVLLLQHTEPGRRWTLNIQELPERAITLRGVEPTAEEMTRVLSYTSAPVWMIAVCMVIAATAKRLPAEDETA